jgi:hypothetical protein
MESLGDRVLRGEWANRVLKKRKNGLPSFCGQPILRRCKRTNSCRRHPGGWASMPQDFATMESMPP